MTSFSVTRFRNTIFWLENSEPLSRFMLVLIFLDKLAHSHSWSFHTVSFHSRITNNGNTPVEPSFQNLFCLTTFAPVIHHLLINIIPEEGFHYDVVPFDLYCPSMRDKLDNGVCKICGKYWRSEAAMKCRKKSHKKKIEVEVDGSGEGRKWRWQIRRKRRW